MSGTRPTYDEMMLEVAKVVAKRSTCSRRHVGCVAARDNRILAMGYNGAPVGEKHCDHHVCYNKDGSPEGYWDLDQEGHCVIAIHAEANLICNAAREGILLKGSTVYLLTTPCHRCLGLLINVGVERIVCQDATYAKMHETDRHSWKKTQYRCMNAGIKLEVVDNKRCTCRASQLSTYIRATGFPPPHFPDNPDCEMNKL